MVETALYNPELVPPGQGESLQRELGLEGKIVLLFPHSPAPVKGWRDAVKVLKHLVDRYGADRVTLVVLEQEVSTLMKWKACSRYHSDTDELIDKLNVRDQILPLARVDDPEVMRALYDIVDVVLSPSYRDCMSLAALEAGLMGVPVGGYRTSGMTEVVEEQRGVAFPGSGWLVDMGDSEGLARETERFLEEPGRAARIAEEVPARFSIHFDPDRLIRNHEEVFKRLITGARSESFLPPSVDPYLLTPSASWIDPHVATLLSFEAEEAVEVPFDKGTPERFLWSLIHALYRSPIIRDEELSPGRFDRRTLGFLLNLDHGDALPRSELEHLAREVVRVIKGNEVVVHLFILASVE